MTATSAESPTLNTRPLSTGHRSGTIHPAPGCSTSPRCRSDRPPRLPGCCWLCRTWSPWTCPAWSPPPGIPGTKVIPALNYLLSLLALKLTGVRRVSHVDDLAADPGAALFAGLTALPKTTALTSYSYRLEHTRQTALLTALGKAMIGADLITDTGGDLVRQL
jgi:hypothetical protein